jgi:hypothetical protein
MSNNQFQTAAAPILLNADLILGGSATGAEQGLGRVAIGGEPSLNGATYNAADNTLILTGYDLDSGSADNVAGLTLTGQGGKTYTLTSASSITAIGANNASVTITLTGVDATKVNALFDQNGATSQDGTTFTVSASSTFESDLANLNTPIDVTVSGVAPPNSVVSLVSSPTAGVQPPGGGGVSFLLTTSAPLSLTGSDSLTLNNGASAGFVSGVTNSDGTYTATFTYNPSPGDNFTADLQVTGFGGFTVSDSNTPLLDTGVAINTKQTTVNTEAELNAAIATLNAGGVFDNDQAYGAFTINLGADITLTSALTAIDLPSNISLTISGGSNDYSINGNKAYQGLVVDAGAVTIENTAIDDAVAQGGAGAGGFNAGGGGAGLGGGVFVGASATVTLSDVSFSGDKALGGAGGAGNGEDSNGGSAGGLNGAAASGGFGDGQAGINGYPPGGAGGGLGNGGRGFGGGAAGSNGCGDGGGGGLAAGADVFVQSGGTLSITGGSSLGAGTVTGGAGGAGFEGYGDGNKGGAFGSGIFIGGNQTLTLGAGQTASQKTEIDGVIADQKGSGGTGAGALVISGDGTVYLKASTNTFTGGTTIDKGATLELGNTSSAGGGDIAFGGANANLVLDTVLGYQNLLTGLVAGDTIDVKDGTLSTLDLKLNLNDSAGSDSYSKDYLSLSAGPGGTDLSLDPTQNYSDLAFLPTSDGASGSLITVYNLPTVTSLTGSVLATSSLTIGQTDTFTMTTDEAISVGLGAYLTLSNGGEAALASGNNSATTTWTYTVGPTDEKTSTLTVSGYSGSITSDSSANTIATNADLNLVSGGVTTTTGPAVAA